MEKFVRWLRKPRRWTTSSEKAEKSIFQWHKVEVFDFLYIYSLSLLGAINGILPLLTGFVLVVVYGEKEKPIRFEFRKKWW